MNLKVGDIIRLEEPYYRYGTGPLILRLTAVPVRFNNSTEWFEAMGIELRNDGLELQPRRAVILLQAVKRVKP